MGCQSSLFVLSVLFLMPPGLPCHFAFCNQSVPVNTVQYEVTYNTVPTNCWIVLYKPCLFTTVFSKSTVKIRPVIGTGNWFHVPYCLTVLYRTGRFVDLSLGRDNFLHLKSCLALC